MAELGFFYLYPSYRQGSAPDIATSQGLTNPYIQGFLIRETWERLFQDGYGTFNWDFLDEAFDACEANGKTVALQVEPGINSPSEFFDLPGAKQIIAGADLVPSTVPFDPVFQSEWSDVQTEIANRYKTRPSLKYLKIQGPGIASESFFALTAAEQSQAAALATEFLYADMFEAWLNGVSTLIDDYAAIWTPIPIQLVTGSPFGTQTESIPTLQAAFDYGDSTYLGQFASVAHDLTTNGPHLGEISQTIITDLSSHCVAVGYQFGNHQNSGDSNPPARLTTALQRGLDYGARIIEIFTDDADDPRSPPALLLALEAWGITDSPPAPSPTPSNMPTIEISSGATLNDLIDDALTDAFSITETTLVWNGQRFGCVLNADQNVLVTSKNLFPANGLPKIGDVVNVAGKDRQVTGRANSAEQFVPGGLSSDTTFVDDPANPSVAIEFSSFIGK